MKLGLGIDTGRTYTDAVLIYLSDGTILDFNKALTTHSNIIEGIENVIAGLKEDYLKDIKLVSVSTTLSTNSTLESKGHATMVRAVKILTSAMGGDSHVWLQGKICIGPNRVIPLCLEAFDYPFLGDKLRKTEKISDRMVDNILQQTSFLLELEALILRTIYTRLTVQLSLK